MNLKEIEDLELELLLEAIYRRYGHDFRLYAQASMRRRVQGLLPQFRCERISQLIPMMLHQPAEFKRMLPQFSVTVTEMFRDPDFYLALRKKVVPYLRTYPFIKIWLAGCATGEEVYSLAILLKEEGLYDRATIFATDFNDAALQVARDGIYPIDNLREFSTQYQLAGGSDSLSSYFYAGFENVIMDQSLRERVTFANHNLVTDGVFGEMHLVFCRNVMIYFQRELQNRVLRLFRDSLIHKGFLCLGSKETISFLDDSQTFDTLDPDHRIYRKKLI